MVRRKKFIKRKKCKFCVDKVTSIDYKEYDLYKSNGEFSHKLISTNELLGKLPLVVAGKTGETPKSGGCLLLVIKAPKSKGYVVSVVLNSPDRFLDMGNIISWDKESYQW